MIATRSQLALYVATTLATALPLAACQGGGRNADGADGTSGRGSVGRLATFVLSGALRADEGTFATYRQSGARTARIR
ncbi:hypothetical protein [Streptomyces boncukensis]|uniref:Uncharacterized protein n=1 Tax=Streptomyces boncukensis TaxID=2711219 RepID=A0A6G4WUT4_9ACTN|nr:hypothetical protein [Streptomyces boncukensis]NGO68304.1 hypothetical protein [Streptomyces boncukensis]